ncbi:MAG: DUF4834 family protein [Bacteroidetes bacterium]|nr:DUF4834 family protein [Bacteroidota bacterium]
MGFLKFLFIVIVIYYLLKFIGRYILPYLISVFIKRAHDQMMRNESNNSNAKTSKKVGEVSIDSAPKKSNKASKDNVGDYVDFEEVND